MTELGAVVDLGVAIDGVMGLGAAVDLGAALMDGGGVRILMVLMTPLVEGAGCVVEEPYVLGGTSLMTVVATPGHKDA